ncbi:mobilization protein [Salmonella enterica]|nr:mobilization protein [Salmonella enterica]
MAKTRAEKLEELQKKENQIKAQIQQLKQREQAEERKKDTRRKILIGGAILAKLKRGEWNHQQLIALLDSELKTERDRALFEELNLPTLTPETKP